MFLICRLNGPIPHHEVGNLFPRVHLLRRGVPNFYVYLMFLNFLGMVFEVKGASVWPRLTDSWSLFQRTARTRKIIVGTVWSGALLNLINHEALSFRRFNFEGLSSRAACCVSEWGRTKRTRCQIPTSSNWESIVAWRVMGAQFPLLVPLWGFCVPLLSLA